MNAPAVRKRSQRYRAIDELPALMPPAMKSALDRLRAVLDEAQNRPPDGKSDGSIGAAEWERLKKAVDAGEAFWNAAFHARWIYCNVCRAEMTPAEAVGGGTCLKCCRKSHARVARKRR